MEEHFSIGLLALDPADVAGVLPHEIRAGAPRRKKDTQLFILLGTGELQGDFHQILFGIFDINDVLGLHGGSFFFYRIQPPEPLVNYSHD